MQGLRLFEALKTNNFCIMESYNELQNNFNEVIENDIEGKEKGYSSNTPNKKILCMVRHFFSDVYSFLNIFARIYSSFLSSGAMPTPSISFNKHRKMVLENSNNEEFVIYSKVLENLTWYEKFHILRSEETHFLLGTITVEKKEGRYLITYFSRTDSPREERTELIEINDVPLFIAEIINGVNQLYDHISVEILKSINPNKCCHIPFGVKDHLFCVKNLSIVEFILNKPGKCVT